MRFDIGGAPKERLAPYRQVMVRQLVGEVQAVSVQWSSDRSPAGRAVVAPKVHSARNARLRASRFPASLHRESDAAQRVPPKNVATAGIAAIAPPSPCAP